MKPRMQFWCKCRAAYEAAWEKAMHDAREETFARTGKMTERWIVALESDFEEDAPQWLVTGGIK